MVDSNKLIGLFAEKGYTRGQVAKTLEISENTLRRKLRIGKFNSDEMDKLIELLEISEPCRIFFAPRVTR